MSNQQGKNALEILLEESNYKATEAQKRLTLSDEKVDNLKKSIELVRNGIFNNTKEKGDALEDLTQCIFDSFGVFESLNNIHTSTNEIDFLCRLNSQGRISKSSGYFEIEDSFLIECKNLNTTVNVTHVDKFAALLLLHGKKLGIIISRKGVTGTSKWKDSKGFIKKFYLKNNILIVSLTLTDIESLFSRSLFELVREKKDEIIYDCDISKYIVPHPAQT